MKILTTEPRGYSTRGGVGPDEEAEPWLRSVNGKSAPPTPDGALLRGPVTEETASALALALGDGTPVRADVARRLRETQYQQDLFELVRMAVDEGLRLRGVGLTDDDGFVYWDKAGRTLTAFVGRGVRHPFGKGGAS